MIDYKVDRVQLQGSVEWALANIMMVFRQELGVRLDAATLLWRLVGHYTAAIASVYVERVRQMVEKGWTPSHDVVEHSNGSLITFALDRLRPELVAWPLRTEALIEAAALLVAEIERRVEGGAAIICDRCGGVYDEAPKDVAPESLKCGESQICQRCYAAQLVLEGGEADEEASGV